MDASPLARHYVHAHLQVPIAGGPVALSVPKWIPGAHAPHGKGGLRLVSIVFRANGTVLPWRRDLVDAFMFHVDAPAGARTIEADFDFLPPASQLSTRVLNFHWNSVMMYVTGKPVREIPVVASLKLPAGWHFGTALPVEKQTGDTVQFKTASLETMVDSPVLVGQYMKEVPLTPGGPREHFLDVATESEAELPTDATLIGHFTTLIGQAQRLYGSQLPLPIEHHESSGQSPQRQLLRRRAATARRGYLLPHEYSHSRRQSFRRPADLATTDYQQPMKTDLLWSTKDSTTTTPTCW